VTPPSIPLTRQRNSRAQAALLFVALTAGIATGLAIYSSASAFIDLMRTATAVLFLPLLLALVLAFLLDPPVTVLERRCGRSGAIFVVYLLVAAGVFLFFNWLIPHWQNAWTSLQADLPRYTARLTVYLRELLDRMQAEFPFIDTHDLLGRARSLGEELVSGVIISTPKSALRIGGLMLMVPLFTFFFLRDGGRILRGCISLAPNRTFEMVHDLTNLITAQLAHFIRGRIIEATIVGLVIYIGLSFTDIRYTGFLAVFAGITNLIPYIGPLVGMVPGVLVALVDLGVGGQFWWIIITYFVVAQVIVDNFILIPILISRYSNLHPLWVIIAIVLGGKLYGVLGMIIGVPIASTVKIVLSEIRQYRRSFSLVDGNIDLDS
jgi:putative permease